MKEIEIEHRTCAHCENGTISTLLRHNGIELSEPMIFGLASGLYFAHLPFIKMAGMPVTAFRTFPGVLFSRITKMLGVKVGTRRFLSPEKAMEVLDDNLHKHIIAKTKRATFQNETSKTSLFSLPFFSRPSNRLNAK